jgi:hypothetical protein
MLFRSVEILHGETVVGSVPVLGRMLSLVEMRAVSAMMFPVAMRADGVIAIVIPGNHSTFDIRHLTFGTVDITVDFHSITSARGGDVTDESATIDFGFGDGVGVGEAAS